MGSLELLSYFWSLDTILVVQISNFDLGGLSHPPSPSFNETNIFHLKTNLCGDYVLLSQHGLCRIHAHIVANRVLSRIRAFLVLFCPDFYSDI